MSKLQVKRIPEEQPKDYALLPVGKLFCAMVDKDDYEKLKRYHWKLSMSSHCLYAVRKEYRFGKINYIKLHREVMKTPANMDCHHKNHKTLDCRKENLINLTKSEHQTLHNSQL